MNAKVDLRQLEAVIANLTAEQKESLIEKARGPLALRFRPNPGPQHEAYHSLADETFYGGAAGGGKSALICGLAVNEHSVSHIYRREATQLRGIIAELRRILGDEGSFNGQDNIWTLPDGKVIELGGVKDENDKEKWQGRAASLKAFDEITQFSESQYRYIIGWNRAASGERCRVVATGNPPTTAEGLWVMKYWAPWLDPTHPNPAKPGELRWFTTIKGEDVECDGPDPVEVNGKLVKPRSRTFIRSFLEDNPDYMDTDYASVLEAMPEELRQKLREGRFDVEAKDNGFQVIPSSWIRAAMARWTASPPAGVGMSVLSHDVALGGGDANTYARRYGHWYDEIVSEKLKGYVDPIDLAARDIALMRDGCPIVIDMGGGYGSGVYSHLKQNVASVTLHGHNGSGVSTKRTRDGKLKFKNKRAEVWWRFREALEPNLGEPVALPNDPELLADLAAPTWKLTSSGLVIEEKTEIKKRLGRSPDKGDAVVNAWAYGEDSVSARIRVARNPTGAPRVNLGHASMKARRR